MFYKMKKFYVVAILAVLSSFNTYAQELNLLGDDAMIAPPKKTQEPVSLELEDISLDVEPIEDVKNADLNEDPLMAEIKEDVLNEEKKAQEAPKAIEVSDDALAVEEIEISQPEVSSIEDADIRAEFENNEIFSKMTALEREAALLTLQLKRERIKNDIDAVKQVRKDAIEQEKERKEALLEKKRQEALKNQQILLKEQQALKDKEIAFEKLRQETVLNTYKEEMLMEKQEALVKNEALYKELKKEKEDSLKMIAENKQKLLDLKKETDEANAKAIEVKNKKDQEISTLKTRLAVLQSQLDAGNAKNPFGEALLQADDNAQRLDNVYAIMEIRGKNDKLIAKLLTKEGQSFLAQVGTELQTGHVVEEISETYLKAGKNGFSEYIYFAAGGILNKEPKKSTINQKANVSKTPAATSDEIVKPSRSFNIYSG